jgi:hypothetical protein
MALTSKYDPPVPATEYCPKPLMVYTLSVNYRKKKEKSAYATIRYGLGPLLTLDTLGLCNVAAAVV